MLRSAVVLLGVHGCTATGDERRCGGRCCGRCGCVGGGLLQEVVLGKVVIVVVVVAGQGGRGGSGPEG